MFGFEKRTETPPQGPEVMSASRAALKASDNEIVIEKVRNYQGFQASIDNGYNTTTGNDEDAKLREEVAQEIRTSLGEIGVLLVPSENPALDESVAEFVKEMDLRLIQKN